MYEIIEKRAIAVAKTMNAEYWSVSSKTGDGILELFTRVAALSFDATVLREINNSKIEKTQIGSDLISKF